MSQFDAGLMWFRRDLRASDNAALHHALRSCRKVWCVFVFDTGILDPLPRADRRVAFIRESLVELDTALRTLGAQHGHERTGLIVLHDAPIKALPAIAEQLGVQAVFANHDDEPDALERDAQVFGALAHNGVLMRGFKDHVIFERREVLTQAGQAFGVFTPYKNAWLKALTPFHLKAYPIERHAGALAPLPEALDRPVPTLAQIGFEPSNLAELRVPTGESGAQALFDDFLERIDRYTEARDYPAVKGPSYLSVHLRFGTISIRALAGVAHMLQQQGNGGAATWLSELIWRDFYHQILANFPHVVKGSFRPEYDAIRFEHGKRAQNLFEAWCEGRTGYPLVDAAMAQINQTGYMHNRLRMVTASFLIKDLGVHWQWGERYFAEKLIDFDLAANNGGWQWAASSGCDAQPWFRIFNPVTQSEKFDPQGRFIRRYLPQLEKLPDAAIHAPWKAHAVELVAAGVELGKQYPEPLIDHALARDKTLERYAVVKKQTPA